MTSPRNKGKRPVIDYNDGINIKRKSISTPRFGGPGRGRGHGHGHGGGRGCPRANNLNEAQPLEEVDDKAKVDVEILAQKHGDVVADAIKAQMIQNDERLDQYGHDIMVMKEELKSIKEAVSSMSEKFAIFEASFMGLQQRMIAGFKGTYDNDPFVMDKGHPSNSKSDPPFDCEICTDTKTGNESFSIQGCSHTYCKECMIKYVASKLEENITSISCPVADCKGFLHPEYCQSVLPQDVFDRWGKALCVSVVIGDQKFYCPYKDCSALMIDDGEEVIRESECPSCRRMFCAQCQVPWHAGIQCEEFQKLNEDERESEDIMLMKIAQNKNWKRCPNCRYYVEKREGCMYMKCRCGTAFCFNCGTPSNKFADLHHYCTNCGN